MHVTSHQTESVDLFPEDECLYAHSLNVQS